MVLSSHLFLNFSNISKDKLVYIDESNVQNSVAIALKIEMSQSSNAGSGSSFTMPVKEGNYWKVVNVNIKSIIPKPRPTILPKYSQVPTVVSDIFPAVKNLSADRVLKNTEGTVVTAPVLGCDVDQ